jgi:hypothetical protein
MTDFSLQRLEWPLWLMTFMLAASAVARSFSVPSGSGQRSRIEVERLNAIARLDPQTLAAAADDVTSGNLFREGRQPADTDVAAGQLPRSVALPIPSTPPKPRLDLRGVIGGPPWQAIIAGLPGHENGVVIAHGEIVAGFSIRFANRDSVIVQGMDTTWHLTMPRR